MADWSFDDITARAADAAVKGQFDPNLKTQDLLNSIKASLSGTLQVLLFREGVAVTPIPLTGAPTIAGDTLTWPARNVTVTFAATHDIDSGAWTGRIQSATNKIAYAASVGKTTGVIRVSGDITAGASTVTLGPITMTAPNLNSGSGVATDPHYSYPPGFAATVGGRGGQIIKVTNLNTSGAGSLKAALDTAGPRIVVFETSGVLDLGGAVWTITEPYLTVAGQTAPSPGFNIIKGAINTKTHDVIIQHLRIRTGSAAGSTVDALEALDGSVDVIFDHNSLSWGRDEILSAGGYPFDGSTIDSYRSNSAHRVTFSHNIIAEALTGTGSSGYGTLMEDNTTQNLLYGNLWAHNPERTPNFGGGAQGAVINNVIYNPGGKFIDYTFLNSKWDSEGGGLRVNGKITAIGNVALDGPDSATYGFMTIVSNGDLEYYGADNIALRADGTTPIPQTYTSTYLTPTGAILTQGAPNVMPSGLTPRPASEVESYVIANAGARPWDRDAHDIRVTDSVTNRNGSHIADESAVGGYPSNVVNTATFNPSEWNLDTMTPISGGGGGGVFTPGAPPGGGWTVVIAPTDTPVVVPANFVGWHRYFNIGPSPYPYKTHRGHDQRGVNDDVSTIMARMRPNSTTWNRQFLDEFLAQTPGKTRVLPIFGTPTWARKYTDTASFGPVKYPSFPDMASAPVADFVASVVDRIFGAWGYTASDFPFLEVWNEPSFGYSGGQSYLDPVAGQRWTSANNPLRGQAMFFNGDHNDLARIAREIKENVPGGVTVMGCGFELGLESNGSTRMFNPSLFAAAGGMAYIDWFTYHSYIYGYDPSVVTSVRGNVRAWLNANGYTSMPMANSETGYEYPGPAFNRTDAEIAAGAIRMFLRSAIDGDKMFIAYQDRGDQDIYNNPQGPTFKNPTGSATIQAALQSLDALNGKTIRQAQFNADGRVWVRFSNNTELSG